MLIVILVFVLFAIFFNGKPQGAQFLRGGAVLNLIGDGIEPLLQPAITDELSAFISAMNEYHIRPALDAYNQVFGNFQQQSDRPYSNTEFLRGLEAAK